MQRTLLLLLALPLASACKSKEPAPAPATGALPAEAPGQAAPAIDPNELVKVKLVGLESHLQAGVPTELAAYFEIADGWHIYWKNPGETGLPTTVELAVPDDFEKGEVRYPGPEPFKSPGDVTSYGYKGSTALFIEIRPPQQPKGNQVFFSAMTEWLACRETCIKGKARAVYATAFHESDPVATNLEILAAHRDRLPRPLAELPGASHGWAKAESGWRLTVTLPGADEAVLFPGPGPILWRGQEARRRDGAMEIQATLAPVGAGFPKDGAFSGVARVKRGDAVEYYELSAPWPG